MNGRATAPAWRRWLTAGWATPAGLLVRAGLIAAAFGLVHASGFRECVGILCGTSATSAPPTTGMAAMAAAYVLARFAWVVAAPILVLAAAILWLAGRIEARAGRKTGAVARPESSDAR